jgi:hypothetical protein
MKTNHWTEWFMVDGEEEADNKRRITTHLFAINQFWYTFTEHFHWARRWEPLLKDYDGMLQELSACLGVDINGALAEFDTLSQDYWSEHKVAKLKCYQYLVNLMWSNVKKLKSIPDKDLAPIALKSSDLVTNFCFHFVPFLCKDIHRCPKSRRDERQ